MLGRQSPKIETMLRDAAPGLLAFADFPVAHWKKIWSTNQIERLNTQIKRRTDVVDVFDLANLSGPPHSHGIAAFSDSRSRPSMPSLQ